MRGVGEVAWGQRWTLDQAEGRGRNLQVVEWLLPVNQRRVDFLTTDPTVVEPTSTFEEFRVASTLASVLLEGSEEREISSARLDDGIDSEPVGLLTTADNRYIAVVPFTMAYFISKRWAALQSRGWRNKFCCLISTSKNLIAGFVYGSFRLSVLAFFEAKLRHVQKES